MIGGVSQRDHAARLHRVSGVGGVTNHRQDFFAKLSGFPMLGIIDHECPLSTPAGCKPSFGKRPIAVVSKSGLFARP